MGQRVELASGRGEFLFVGIPDGQGLFLPDDETAVLFVNHEISGVAGDSVGNRPSGGRVSSLYLDTTDPSNISVRGGRYTIDRIFEVTVSDTVNGDQYAEVTMPGPIYNTCSATLADDTQGFTQPIYFLGEEVPSPRGFDGQGGLCWAIIDHNAYMMPRLGHGSWENAVPAVNTAGLTVMFPMEDPRAAGDNKNAQFYMYVGPKIPGSSDLMARNGLSTGFLHVMKSGDPTRESEDTFTLKGTSIPCEWVQVDYTSDDRGLESEARSLGSFNFFRIEDGVYDRYALGVLYFTSTGHPGETNEFGRLYRYDFDPYDPLAGGTLTILLDGSEGMKGPDNIDINRFGEILINEDPNHNLDLDLGLTRDSSVWLYDTVADTLVRVAEMDRASAIAHALAADPQNSNTPAEDYPGGWESSGTIDAETLWGPGSWILTVQAHSLSIEPNGVTVQGGQVMRLTYTSPFRGPFRTPVRGQ